MTAVRSRNLIYWVLYFALAIYALAWLWVFPIWRVDDSFILLHFAKHLFEFGEITWNIGSKPVEGYTGILLILIVSGSQMLGFTPENTIIFVSSFSLVLSCVFYWRIMHLQRFSQITTLLFTFFFVVTGNLYRHAYSGLETTLFLALVTASAYLFLRTLRDQKMTKIFALCLLLMSLCRPEGVVLAAMLASYACVHLYVTNSHEVWKNGFVIGFLFVLPYAAYLAWKYYYYGSFLPVTYSAKSSLSFFSRSMIHAEYVFLRRNFLVPIALTSVFCFPYVDTLWKSYAKQPTREKWLSIGPYIVFVGYLAIHFFVYATKVPNMGYASRFFIPVLPLLAIPVAKLFDLGIEYLKACKVEYPIRFRVSVGLCILLSLLHVSMQLSRINDSLNTSIRYKKLIDDVHIPVGKYIGNLFPGQCRLAVLNDSGAIPYHADCWSVDFFGLTDASIAQARVQKDYPKLADIFFQHNIDVMSITSKKWTHVEAHVNVQKAIMTDSRFKNYRFLRKYRSEDKTIKYYQFIYVNTTSKNLPKDTDLTAKECTGTSCTDWVASLPDNSQ